MINLSIVKYYYINEIHNELILSIHKMNLFNSINSFNLFRYVYIFLL